MTFDVTHDIADVGDAGGEITVEPPPAERWVTTPLRRREVDERDRLLEGIAPPTRKLKLESAKNRPAAKKGTR